MRLKGRVRHCSHCFFVGCSNHLRPVPRLVFQRGGTQGCDCTVLLVGRHLVIIISSSWGGCLGGVGERDPPIIIHPWGPLFIPLSPPPPCSPCTTSSPVSGSYYGSLQRPRPPPLRGTAPRASASPPPPSRVPHTQSRPRRRSCARSPPVFRSARRWGSWASPASPRTSGCWTSGSPRPGRPSLCPRPPGPPGPSPRRLPSAASGAVWWASPAARRSARGCGTRSVRRAAGPRARALGPPSPRVGSGVCVWGGVPCAVRALCQKLAVLHHREFGKFRRLKGRH